MRYIEEGINLNGDPCWFVLENVDLIGTYLTLEEAQNNL